MYTIAFSKDYDSDALKSINVCNCHFGETKDTLVVKFPNQEARQEYSQAVENLKLNPWQQEQLA